MDDQRFRQLVSEGIDAIPEKFADKLDNVAIVVEDEPTPEQKRKLNLREHSLLFGLYEGVPQTKRGGNYSMVLPDKITIFKNPILKYAKTPEKIKEKVTGTVWHEIAHHFGLEEHEVRHLESKRHQHESDNN